MNSPNTLRLVETPQVPIVPVWVAEPALAALPEQWTAPSPVAESVPITLVVDPASSSALPKRQAVELGEKPVSMTVLSTEHDRKGESNNDADPYHTALLQHVANLGLYDLDRLALGDHSFLPGLLLGRVSNTAIDDAIKYAGNLANTRRQQASHSQPSERANPGIFSQLTRFVQQSAAGREAAPLIIEAPAQAELASTPLPVREPGKNFREELPELRNRLRAERGGGVRLGADKYVKPVDRVYNGYPAAEPVNDPYHSTNNHDDSDTQIIAKLHYPAETVRLPDSEVSVAVNGSITRTETRAQEPSRFRTAIAAGVAAVAELVSRGSGQHRAPRSYRGQRRSLALVGN